MYKGKKFGLLILFISVSFLGLLWTQFLWVSNNIKMSNAEFDDETGLLIAEVVEAVEEDKYCVNMFGKVDLPKGEMFRILTSQDSLNPTDTIPLYLFFKNSSKVDSLYSFEELSFNYPAEIKMNLSVQFLSDKIEEPNIPITDFHGFERGFEDSILDMKLLDSLLYKTFISHGINQDFEFALQNPRTKNIVYSSVDSGSIDQILSGVKTTVFDDNRYYKTYALFVQFPHKNAQAIGNNIITIVSACALVVMIVLLFITFFRILFQERKLSEMKVDFVNNITHEFKTPLSNIKLAANALRKELAGKSNRLIDIIEEENERLQKGIDLALTTSLLNKDEIILNKERLDLHDVLSQLVESSTLIANENNGTITGMLMAKESTIMVDELHITNVFNNLIYNALKYSNTDPIITISTTENRGGLVIAVKDNGIGIDSKNLPYIFDRFYRVSTKNRHETRGYGIGLYYVKMIVEAHGGKVSATSNIGIGTTFSIWLPINE